VSCEGIRRVDYKGELWTLQKPHPALADFLTAKDLLIVLRHGEPPFKVVLGVPHQAAVGEGYICEERLDENGNPNPRDSDENAASYALVAFTTLRDKNVPCKLVIMAHATTHDPNKEPTSHYCQEIFADTDGAPLLLECHGTAPQRRLPLELSAGNNYLSRTVRFGQALAAALGSRYAVGVQEQACTKSALIFRTDGTEEKGVLERAALQTVSLVEAGKRGMPALHLEAKPAFRKPADGTNTVTPDGLILGRAIAQAIIQYLSGSPDGSESSEDSAEVKTNVD
jgi:hypothetical protein